MLKIQARLQQYVSQELPDVQAGFRKGRGTRDQIANICWIIEKARDFQKKTSTSSSLTMLKSLTVWITTNCGKFLKSWEYQTTLPDSWEAYVQVKRQQLEPDMEEWTGSKLGKEYIKGVYLILPFCISFSWGWFWSLLRGRRLPQGCILSPCLFNRYAEYIMPNARLDEAQDGIMIAGRNISSLRYADNTTLWQKAKRN